MKRSPTHFARLVLELPFGLLCLLAAFILVACSPRDRQREKDKTDRKHVVGVWSSGTTNKAFGTNIAFGITGINADGSTWSSNTFGSGPSARGFATTGTWNIIDGKLVLSVQVASNWNWGTRRRPQLLGDEHCTIVWATDHELALELDDDVLNIHLTNILRRVK